MADVKTTPIPSPLPQGVSPSRLLVIRRDNIGDLVCTTPMFAALKRHWPDARIHALVNSYNAAVLDGHPHVDRVHVYQKGKHRVAGDLWFAPYLGKARLLWDLRQLRFDFILLPNNGYAARAARMAQWLGASHIIGFAPSGGMRASRVDIPVAHDGADTLHEVEDIFRLLKPLGIDETPPPVHIVPRSDELARARAMVRALGVGTAPIAVHISARKPSNRWPPDSFAALIRELYRRHGRVCALFWAPGASSNPQHPGDDAVAQSILAALKDVPVLAYPTETLATLIGGMACCDCFIGGDGGAMHLAAGLGLPVLAFFGRSGAVRWRPWGVPHVVFQPPTLEAADITVTAALNGIEQLWAQCPPSNTSCSAP